MAARTGEVLTATPSKQATQGALADVRCVALAGSGISPIPVFLMAQWDNSGTRRFWPSGSPDANERPTSGVSLPFSGDPVIIGRIT